MKFKHKYSFKLVTRNLTIYVLRIVLNQYFHYCVGFLNKTSSFLELKLQQIMVQIIFFY